MNKKNEIVRFQASVAQIRTMADGGLRVALDLSENEIDTVTKLMKAKRAGAILEIALLAIDPGKMETTNMHEFDFSFDLIVPVQGIDE